MIASGHRAASMVLLSLSLAACARGDAASPADTLARTEHTELPASSTLSMPVVVETARDGDLVLTVSTTGQLRSDAALALRADVGGTVSAVLVRAGARVAQGQPLVRLYPYPFELAEREARASADESEQRYLESYVPESLVTGQGPTPEQRRALMNRAGLVGARLRLERARWERQRATVTSPVDGTVDAVDVAPGERLSAGQPLVTVVDTRNLRVEAQVLEHDLPLVKTGGEATVKSAGAPGRTIRGRIDAVLPLVDSITRAGRAVVRVQGDGTLRAGMYADVTLEATRLPGRRLVPTRAIIERDGRPVVFVINDGRARWTYILPGRSNGIDTEVLPDSGTGVIPVMAGDSVIVDGHLTLTHDAPVRAAPPTRDATPSPSRRPRPGRD